MPCGDARRVEGGPGELSDRAATLDAGVRGSARLRAPDGVVSNGDGRQVPRCDARGRLRRGAVLHKNPHRSRWRGRPSRRRDDRHGLSLLAPVRRVHGATGRRAHRAPGASSPRTALVRPTTNSEFVTWARRSRACARSSRTGSTCAATSNGRCSTTLNGRSVIDPSSGSSKSIARPLHARAKPSADWYANATRNFFTTA